MKLIVPLALTAILLSPAASQGKTGVEFLKESPAPVFKEGHTLLPLTRWAWPLSVEMNLELAERWGYALDIDPGWTGKLLDDPSSPASRMVAYHKANPARYPVSVNTRRVVYEWETIQTLLSPQAWCRDASGQLIMRDGRPLLKPYISDADAQAIAQAEVSRLKRLKSLEVNISVVLNGAEYMPGVAGNEGTFWRQDPQVAAWLDSFGPAGSVSVAKLEGLASNKAKQEQAIRDAVLSVAPEAQVVYYGTGDGRRGITSEEARLSWVYPYRFMIKGSSLPSWEYYYSYFGSWTPNSSEKASLPVLATNSAAQGIEDGRPLSYNWVSGGWSLTNPSLNSDDRRYLGFLKYLYTLGSLGNVGGYFSFPPGGFNGDLGASPPDWLRQLILLSHAHATFTHLEDFLRSGDLLPGDGSHFYSIDLYGKPSWPHPSYEFRTTENSPTARVAARKMQNDEEWLVVAWTADGPDRQIGVTIPNLGELNLMARAEGSLYVVRPGQMPTLLDPQGMDPSRKVAELLASANAQKPLPPSNVSIN